MSRCWCGECIIRWINGQEEDEETQEKGKGSRRQDQQGNHQPNQ